MWPGISALHARVLLSFLPSGKECINIRLERLPEMKTHNSGQNVASFRELNKRLNMAFDFMDSFQDKLYCNKKKVSICYKWRHEGPEKKPSVI